MQGSRAAPDPASYSQPPIEVAIGESACPDCGGKLCPDDSDFVTITDAPPPSKPIVMAFQSR